MPEQAHIAGAAIVIGDHLRQRCGWCGAILVDEDLRHVAAVVDDDGAARIGVWPRGSIIVRDSHAEWILHGNALPKTACVRSLPHDISAM